MSHFRREVKNSSKKNHTFYYQAALPAGNYTAPYLSQCYLSLNQGWNLLTTVEEEKLTPIERGEDSSYLTLGFDHWEQLHSQMCCSESTCDHMDKARNLPCHVWPSLHCQFWRCVETAYDSPGLGRLAVSSLSIAASLTIWLNARKQSQSPQ